MKKLTLKALELGAKEVLTREQLKNVLGGEDGSGSGTCIRCYSPSGTSCWYTLGDSYDLCIRVYPNYTYAETVSCNGCTMN